MANRSGSYTLRFMDHRIVFLLALCAVQIGCTTAVSRTPEMICQERGLDEGTELYSSCVKREADRIAFGRYAAELELYHLREKPPPALLRVR